jgi:hypothetical protein
VGVRDGRKVVGNEGLFDPRKGDEKGEVCGFGVMVSV